jgi:hypothetical protein
LLQQYPDGLSAAKRELAAAEEAAAEAENTPFDSGLGYQDEGIQWDDEQGCWTFSSLPSPRSSPSLSTSSPSASPSSPEEPDMGISSLPPQRSRAEVVEEKVLSYIAKIHACAAPSGHACPRLLYNSPKTVCRQRTNRQRILAFRQIKDFTKSPFGNGTSSRRNEFKVDEEVVEEKDDKVKVDSWRLANGWYKRLDEKTKAYDMEIIEVREGREGEAVVRGPRELAGEEN